MRQAAASRASKVGGYPKAPSIVTIDKVKYDESKRDAYRENLPICVTLCSLTLIHSVALPQLSKYALHKPP